tara:strand:- start:5969 stop:6979 length:1011 start_codon:yes stop_codon:yes gene_type:complete
MTFYTRSKKAGASLYAQSYVNGKREKFCTDTPDRKLAKERAEKHFASLLLKSQPEDSKTPQTLNMGQLEASYPKLALDINADTREANLKALRHVQSFGDCSGIMSVSLWSDYKVSKLTGVEGAEKASRLRSLRSTETKIRSIFRKDIRNLYGKLPTPLAEWLETKKTKAPPVSYTMPPKALIDKTWEKSVELSFLAPKAHAAFIMAITAGLRAGEIQAFQSHWLQDGKVHVPANENTFQAKSKRARTIPVGEAFIKYCQEGITSADIKAANTWLKQSVGWTTHKGVHEMRKLYGAQIATGYGLYVAQKLLGHTDPKITSDYYAALCTIPDVKVREK